MPKQIEKLMPLYHEMGEGVEEQLPSNEEIILKINELIEVVNEQSELLSTILKWKYIPPENKKDDEVETMFFQN